MNSRTLALCCLAASVSAIAAVPHYGEETTQDEPLLLTPLIKAGRYTDARKLSVVDLNGTEMGNSGYFTVDSADPNIINNLFFWYQPCKDGCDAATAPLLIWLQGGPGGPGTFGATSEIGNWWTDEKGNYHDRCFSWCRTNNCIFVDQPVWTGFSFQTTRDGKPVEDKDILFTNSSHLATMQVFELMEQFMKIFPELHSAPLYITGESYGGLYIPNLAMNIVKNDERAKAAGINLKGLAAGDPAINWLYQAPTYASTLYGMGVVMLDERAALEKLFAESVEHWRHEDPAQCRAGFDVWNTIWNDNGALPGPSGYEKLTGSANTANVLMGGTPMEWAGIGAFFARHSVHRAFHVEGAPKPTNLSDVGIRLYNAFVDSGDFCKPTSPLYASLFVEAGLEMMIYSSTADPLLGPPTTEAAVMSILDAAKALSAKGDAFRNAFLSASKSVWRAKVTDQQVAGYAKCAQVSADSPRFCYSVVRNAGHEAPAYQPRSNYDLIDRFLYRRPWDKAGDDTKLLTCGQCGGVGPFAGFALPECNH